MYSPRAPWTGLTAHMQKHFEAQIRAIACSKLLCQEGLGTFKAGHAQNHHLCSFPMDASILLAWSSQPWCPALAAHPMATVLGHSVPRLFSIQPAQFMPLPVWPRSPSWEHQDMRLCPGGILAKGHGSKLAHAGVPTASHLLMGFSSHCKQMMGRGGEGKDKDWQWSSASVSLLRSSPTPAASTGRSSSRTRPPLCSTPACPLPSHTYKDTCTQTRTHTHALLYLRCFIALMSSSSFRARCRSPFTCSLPLM